MISSNITKRRGRKPGQDPMIARKIVQVLVNNPDGLWIRQLGKGVGVHPTTATRYVEGILAPMVDIQTLGTNSEKPLLKVVKLKTVVLEKLEQGQKLSEILRFLELIDKSL
jgi:hypothetical protein